MEIETITNGDLVWINIEKPTRETIEIELTKRGYPFHELDIEDSLSKRHIPKISKYANHIFILFHFPSLSVILDNTRTSVTRRKKVRRDASTLHFSQLSIFIGHNFLISIHQGD